MMKKFALALLLGVSVFTATAQAADGPWGYRHDRDDRYRTVCRDDRYRHFDHERRDRDDRFNRDHDRRDRDDRYRYDHR